jgi:hypothetical protein
VRDSKDWSDEFVMDSSYVVKISTISKAQKQLFDELQPAEVSLYLKNL